MSPRNSNKNKDVIKELEKKISPILVVNNSSLKPYVELFEYAPENIYQQPLGSLVGFFEVKEFSDESAYVVNFLTSVLKKEYYINPKRPVAESLDSALHKVNMALSELAKHGNIEWLGKINSAICVIEKNNAHFSVSGNAKIFLYRGEGLSEISADLASDSLEPHPLKTFVNVSSGRLEKNDRLLITSADVFHILTLIEIKKKMQRFEGDKFIQFLKTALSNQIEMIATIVIEMTEITIAPLAKAKAGKKSSLAENAFSQQSFTNTSSSDNLAPQQEEELLLDEKNESEYTDEKTKHIYIQGEANENNESATGQIAHAQINQYWDIVKEKITQGSYLTKNEIRKRFYLYKKQLAKRKELRRIEKEKQQLIIAEENKRLADERILQEIKQQQELIQKEEELRHIQIEQEKELERIRIEEESKQQQNLQENELILNKQMTKEEVATTNVSWSDNINVKPFSGGKTGLPRKKGAVDVVRREEEKIIESPQSRFLEKLRLARIKEQSKDIAVLSDEILKKETDKSLPEERYYTDQQEINIEINKRNALSEKVKELSSKLVKLIILSLKQLIVFGRTNTKKFLASSKTSSIVPHFSKIRSLFSQFSNKQKLYTFGALALIFIAPLFIVHFLNKAEKPVIIQQIIAPLSQAELLANEKNIRFNTQIQQVFSGQNIVTTLVANNVPIIISKNSVTILENNQPKEFSFPVNLGTPIRATYMNDLSLILILTDSNNIVSFSSVSTKFTENKISFANISSGSLIGTYLTYLYILDEKNNQIYRFPRADGGFGDQTSWLKDSTSLSNVSDITIDDNIYAIQNNQILKLFRGKKVDFSLETSNTPVHFDKLYTTPDLTAIYALDTKNARLVQYGKDGNIITQFYNEALKGGLSLSVDEQNKVAYIVTSSGLISVSIQ